MILGGGNLVLCSDGTWRLLSYAEYQPVQRGTNTEVIQTAPCQARKTQAKDRLSRLRKPPPHGEYAKMSG